MFKNFYLSRPVVQKEINLLRQELNTAKVETIKIKTEQEMSSSEKEKSLLTHIKNLETGHTLEKEKIIELEKALECSKQTGQDIEKEYRESQIKVIALEQMIKEQEGIINEDKKILSQTDKARQINNYKEKIRKLQIEIEQQKQITFDKNKIINQLQGHGQN